ncbi:MAG TPA: histidine kinase dimerization/phosphoacceptor domain -containing protein [Phenylobacterium sp.]
MAVIRRLSGEEGARPNEVGQRYRTIFETMSEGFVICQAIRDKSGRLVDYWIRDANPAFTRRAPGGNAMIGRRMLEMRPETHPRWFTACHVALARSEPVRFEFWDDPAQRWYDVHMTRLSDDEVGQFYIDITERKKAERYQAQLFDELNHRVKNNLTIVSGLLTMQARTSDPQVREQLLKAVDRIQSIADLHASLYRGGGKDEVQARSYLDDLCARLSRTLLEGREVRLDLHAEDISLPLDEAVQLGIIVNELVTNAAKHAYAPEAHGVIWVRLGKTDDGLCLSVADLGRGMVVEGSEGGLGMRLVNSLVERSRGQLTIKSQRGTSVEVRLPTGAHSQAEPQQDNLL